MRKVWKKRDGFTLIELLIVVAIIGILAGIAIPNFLGARNRARVARVFADFRTISTALESYYVDNTEYPSENTWTADLTPDYITSIPDDPFNPGNIYRYYTDAAAAATGNYWLLVSHGPDGSEDVTEATAGFSWADADRVSGQVGGSDAPTDGYGLAAGDNGWYDPDSGAASDGDLGRGGP
jgi:general secretion pathway protein G